MDLDRVSTERMEDVVEILNEGGVSRQDDLAALAETRAEVRQGAKARREDKKNAAQARRDGVIDVEAVQEDAMDGVKASRARKANKNNVDEVTTQFADKYIGTDQPSDIPTGLTLTREAWAGRINTFLRQTHDAAVLGIFQVGDNLIAAKAQLSTEEYDGMIENDLAVSKRTIQRLVAIASDQRLRMSHSPSLLPASWGTLYQLTRLTDSELDKLADEGKLSPELERDDVEAARKSLRLESPKQPKGASRTSRIEREPREPREPRPDYSKTEQDDGPEVIVLPATAPDDNAPVHGLTLRGALLAIVARVEGRIDDPHLAKCGLLLSDDLRADVLLIAHLVLDDPD